MKNLLKEKTNEFIYNIKNFKTIPIQSLLTIIPFIVCIITILVFLIGFIMFIAQGGYSTQMNALKLIFTNGFKSGFTKGTTYLFYNNILATVITTLLLINLVLIVINVFKNDTRAKKILISATLIIPIVAVIILLIIFLGGNNRDLSTSGFIITMISILMLLGFFVLLFFTESREYYKSFIFTVTLYFVGAPLLLWFLENIVMAILTIIGTIVLIFIASSALKSNSNTTQNNKTFDFPSTTNTENTANNPKEKHQKIIKLELNTTFGVDTDVFGCKCVYYKNNIGAPNQACSVYNFEKGNVVITNKGKRVINVPGCKTPER